MKAAVLHAVLSWKVSPDDLRCCDLYIDRSGKTGEVSFCIKRHNPFKLVLCNDIDPVCIVNSYFKRRKHIIFSKDIRLRILDDLDQISIFV